MIDFNILISIMARNPNRRSKKDIRKHLNASEKKKFMGCSKSSTMREFYNNKYIEKVDRSQINNLNLHLKELEKEEPSKPKMSRRKEIIQIRAEMHETVSRKNKEFLFKINKIDIILAKLTMNKRRRLK